MSSGLIAFIGLLYFAIAAEKFWKADVNSGLIFAGYALAQIGLWRITQ